MPCRPLATLILVAACPALGAADVDAKLEIDAAPFPYPTVAAAMDALLDNREAELSVRAGWTYADEVVDGRPVHWAFTPEAHPAHPSAVRRTPIDREGEVRVSLSYRCEARKPEACEALLAEMRRLNGGMIAEFKRRLGVPKHAREPEAVEFAMRWLAMVDGGQYRESLELLTQYSRTGYTPGEWQRIGEEARNRHGELRERRLRAIHWFENPADVPLAGTFAFMEFEAMYERVPHTTQYLVLHSERGAPFRVMKDEAPFLRLVRVRQ